MCEDTDCPVHDEDTRDEMARARVWSYLECDGSSDEMFEPIRERVAEALGQANHDEITIETYNLSYCQGSHITVGGNLYATKQLLDLVGASRGLRSMLGRHAAGEVLWTLAPCPYRVRCVAETSVCEWLYCYSDSPIKDERLIVELQEISHKLWKLADNETGFHGGTLGQAYEILEEAIEAEAMSIEDTEECTTEQAEAEIAAVVEDAIMEQQRRYQQLAQMHDDLNERLNTALSVLDALGIDLDEVAA
jgi:hypothetical protein